MITKFGDEVSAVDKAIEECSELIQVLCKIKRFGLYNYHPQTHISNLQRLEAEFKDLIEAISYVQKEDSNEP